MSHASPTVRIACTGAVLLCAIVPAAPASADEAAEADENLLSFTSYCVIDRNPKPKIYDG